MEKFDPLHGNTIPPIVFPEKSPPVTLDARDRGMSFLPATLFNTGFPLIPGLVDVQHHKRDMTETRRVRLREAIALWFSGNEAAFSRAVGRSPAQISDMLAGRKSFGEKIARAMEQALSSAPYNVPVGWFDDATAIHNGQPDGKGVAPGSHKAVTNSQYSELPAPNQGSPFTPNGSSLSVPPALVARLNTGDALAVPLLTTIDDLNLGRPPDVGESIQGVTIFLKSWLDKNLPDVSNQRNLCTAVTVNDSMSIDTRDLLLLDCGVTAVEVDGIYAFELHGQRYLKRLQRQPSTGGLTILSDNKNYAPHELDRREAAQINVLARVRGISRWRLM